MSVYSTIFKEGKNCQPKFLKFYFFRISTNQYGFSKLFICLILGLLKPAVAPTQSAAHRLIYGKVMLKNGTAYEGQIRLNKKEALWENIFDAAKFERPALNLLPDKAVLPNNNNQNEFKFGFMELWEDKSPYHNFFFRCNFGDIVSLTKQKGDIFLLTLKGGNQIKLKKNRGDLMKDVFIYAPKLGRLKLDFNEIQSILFMAAPPDFQSELGLPIFGKLLTTKGIFEGYINWDNEERLGKDLISGNNQGIKMDILFEEIAELKADQNGSLIKLKSGRTLFLNKHVDVDKGNSGITISSLSFGKLRFKWKNFISLTIVEPTIQSQSYTDFKTPKLLKGTVKTKSGANYQGQIIYDLDEVYDMEFLNGENNGFEYHIPFKLITKIEPQNDKFSLVSLEDGQQFLLGGHQDVTNKNHGLIVRLATEEAKYIDWLNIKSVHFE